MASQAIKEYDDFTGQDGYVIVDGLDEQTPGGKKLLSTIGGSASYTIETLSGPYTVSSNIVQVNIPDNHKIYEITNLPNDGETIQIIPPTVTEDEVIDVYINIEIPETDGTSHLISVSNLNRMTDAYGDAVDSSINKYGGFAFIHLIYKYYTLSKPSEE